MEAYENISLTIKALIPLVAESNVEDLFILIIFDWDNEYFVIKFSSKSAEGPFEVIEEPLEPTGSKEDFIQSLVFELRQIAICNLAVQITLVESKRPKVPLFSSKQCKSRIEKIAEFSGRSTGEIHNVTFKHEGCDVEIHFYIYENSNTNLLFTTSYYNPHATHELVVKMLSLAEDFTILDRIGFVGFMSDDNFRTVDKCVSLAFAHLMKRVKFISGQKQQAEVIESNGKMNPKDFELNFLEDEVRQKPAPPPAVKHNLRTRNLRSCNVAKAVVDLTIIEEEPTPAGDEISMISVDYWVSEDGLGGSQGRFYANGWDIKCDEAYQVKKVDNRDGLESWLNDSVLGFKAAGLLSDIEIQREIDARMLEDREENRLTGKELSVPRPRCIVENLHDDEAEASSEIPASIKRDQAGTSRSSSLWSSRTDSSEAGTSKSGTSLASYKNVEPVIGRGMDSSTSFDVQLERRSQGDPPKSKLFSMKELQQSMKKETGRNSMFSFGKPSLPPITRIPKFSLSDSRPSHISQSVIEKSPPKGPQTRRPIKSEASKIIRSYIPKPVCSSLLKRIKFPTPGSSGYTPPAQQHARAPASVRDFVDGTTVIPDEEVINLDDDDDDVDTNEENSDVNNNGVRKRKLYTEPEEPNEKKNKFFPSKPAKPRGRPDFSSSKRL